MARVTELEEEIAAAAGPELSRRRESPLERMFSLCAPEDRGEYEPERRSMRVDGHCTTVRLERAFWSVLEEIAADEGVSLPEMIACVQRHCQHVNDKNLASCLRVLCLKYLNTCAWSTSAPG
ncbi:MAG: ribbon-helix-helix domain-containing protein [Halorhodospira sp.]